jgi:hypothetical protein
MPSAAQICCLLCRIGHTFVDLPITPKITGAKCFAVQAPRAQPFHVVTLSLGFPFSDEMDDETFFSKKKKKKKIARKMMTPRHAA